MLARPIMKNLLVAFCMLCFSPALLAQGRLALPQIVNYNSDHYKGSAQNWDMAQDAKGMLYFANSDGLISFDGNNWELHPLPNRTVARSIAIDARQRIYVGGQDELGYFYPNKQGLLQYHSLVALIPQEEQRFADVWDIIVDREEVFFRSINQIMHLKDGKFRIYKPSTEWVFLAKTPEGIIGQIAQKGLMRFENGYWKPYAAHPILQSNTVTGMVPLKNDTLLLGTLKGGLYYLHKGELSPCDFPINHTFTQARINSMSALGHETLAIGTNSAGIFIVDSKGKLQQHFVHQEGLQRNNIRHLFADKNKNLWAALEGGIDFIATNSAIKYIFPDRSNLMSSYSIKIFDRKLYVGTNTGLFYTPLIVADNDFSLTKADFSAVEHTAGQVWNLEEVNGELLMGHEEGGFHIKGGTAHRFFGASGVWLYQPLSHVYPVKAIVTGSYTGLQGLQFDKGQFQSMGHIGAFYESLRFLVYEESERVLWSSHPYRGVFRIALSPDLKEIDSIKTYTASHGLPSLLHNHAFLIKNKLAIATVDGIYGYNPKTDRFEPDPLFYPKFKGMNLQYLKEDQYGNIWFSSHKKLGVIDFSAPRKNELFRVVNFSEIDGKIMGGYEAVYPYNKENVFIAANTGVIHLNYEKYVKNIHAPDVLLSLVRVTDRKKQDSVLYGGHAAAEMDVPKLPYTSDSFRFAFTTTNYEQGESMEYRYKLEGFEGEWSPWEKKNEKDYTNLPAGNYVFKVMSRSNSDNESAISTYAFTIRPAWYLHPASLTSYVLLALLLIILLFLWQKRKLLQQHEAQLYLNQLELDKKEKEVVRLKNEKLENEIDFKNSELTMMTLNLIQKGEVLNKIKEVIFSLKKKEDPEESETHIRHLLRLIRNVERTNDDWDHFTTHFNHINEAFFRLLKERYPDITMTEQRLCAFIRMNLSSKEIAQIMHITIKGVEVGRYRLRKKLKLDSEVNLYEFLSMQK